MIENDRESASVCHCIASKVWPGLGFFFFYCSQTLTGKCDTVLMKLNGARHQRCYVDAVQSGMGNSMTSEKAPCRIAVPLYLWPGYGSLPCAWERILATPAANPIVVVNPDSGPGQKSFELFKNAVDKCQAAGIKVLGYIRTEYTKRDLSLVINDLNLYKSWYNVDGFFVDEMYHWGKHSQ